MGEPITAVVILLLVFSLGLCLMTGMPFIVAFLIVITIAVIGTIFGLVLART